MTNPRGWWGSCPSSPPAPHPSPGGLAKDKARWLRPTSSWGKCTSPAPCPGHETTEPSDRSCPCPRPFRPRLREDSAAALSGQHHFPPSWAPLARVQTGRHVSYCRTPALARVSALLQGRSSAGWRCLLRLPSSRSLPQSPCVRLDACLLSVLSVRASEGRAP